MRRCVSGSHWLVKILSATTALGRRERPWQVLGHSGSGWAEVGREGGRGLRIWRGWGYICWPMASRRNTQGDLEFLRVVLDRVADATAHGEMPFAAAVVRDGELLALENSLVSSTRDPTAHAEVLAIRTAAEKLGTSNLLGCTLYCSCEPCPMCFGAAHYAGISRVVYSATIGDAALAGYDQLPIFASQLKIMGRSPVELVAEMLRDESVALLTSGNRS